LKLFVNIAIFIIALLFTVLVRQIVPENTFDPYILTLDSVWQKPETMQEYFIDINNDKVPEKIRHYDINLQGNSIELWREKKLKQIYIFKDNEKFIGNALKFADLDGDSIQELLFVSVKKDSAYLNILAYKAHTRLLYPVAKLAIDKILLCDGKTDVANNFIETIGRTIYFDLQGGYTIQPRNTYKYIYGQHGVSKSHINSLVTPSTKAFSYKQDTFLLATFVRSTGNTISHNEAVSLKNSTNKDTLKMYETVKHLEYAYGDFSSYILLYGDSLNFAFEPVEFFGWTNYTKSVLLDIDNQPHIVALTNAQIDEPENNRCKSIAICDLQGNVTKKIALPYNLSDVFCENNQLVFFGDKTLFSADSNLKLKTEIENISFAHGFVDVNRDGEADFLAYRNNELLVFSSSFELLSGFRVEQEFTPYPEKNSFTSIHSDNIHSFVYNSRLFYYRFSVAKNNIAIFEYPFLIFVFLLSFAVLMFVSRINTKRLEKENLKLEQIVAERTKEIASQKEEIQLQANELELKNINLLELSKFKKLMTNTVIHDLKNPLNFIIVNANDKKIRQSGYTMLNIVLNVLDINKAQTTQLQLDVKSHSLGKLIQTAILQVAFLAEQKNLTIEKKFTHEYEIKADADLTVRIFVNLLTNALKFSPLNSKITIRATQQDKLLKVDVIDYGKGIAADDLDVIFEEYSQIEAINSGNMPSTGLGLTFCKIAAEAQGMQLLVSSVPQYETCFSLLFPMMAVSENISGKTYPEKTVMNFTADERKQLQAILPKLQQTKLYEATEILRLLNTIENPTENISRWMQKLKTAMYASNTKLYKQLIENELHDTYC